MGPDAGRRLLALERRAWSLGALTDSDERRLTGLEQRIWQRWGRTSDGGGGGVGVIYTFTVYNITNGVIVPGQAVDLIDDATSSVVASGVTDASGVVSFSVPPAYYWLSPNLSGGVQRFDPTYHTGTVSPGAGSYSWSIVEGSGFITTGTLAFPLSDTLEVQDPTTSLNQSTVYSGGDTWSGPVPGDNFAFPGYAGCPAKTAGVTYYLNFSSLELTAEYPATAGGCPDNAAVFLGQSVADITVVDGTTPVITAVPRASQKIWSGGTSTIDVIEL